jgi:hypothetical protein
MSDADAGRDRPNVLAVVAVFLAVALLFAAGVGTKEWWPFTGWRLYSNMKGPTSGSYFAYRVDSAGKEHVVDYHDLPYSYARAPYLLEKFPKLSDAEREAVCDALAHGERGEGRSVQSIEIYWEKRRVVPVDGERHTKLLEREHYLTCAETST